jgi:hypothetical protein
MSAKDNGGPAFPVADDVAQSNSGMTLRDWFAGQAMSNPELVDGCASNRLLDEWFGKGSCNIDSAKVAAKQAYRYADAMLEARK